MTIKKILFGNPKDNPVMRTGPISEIADPVKSDSDKDVCPNTQCVACRVNCPHK